MAKLLRANLRYLVFILFALICIYLLQDGPFKWELYTQGIILGAFYYG